MNTFKVTTEKFNGPLELLLDLIEKRKLLVNDISLANVADDFIEYTKKSEQFPIGESANFILIASTLVLIKSKSLLPTLELTREEEGDIKSLEQRLLELQKIRELSKNIEKMFGQNIMFPRQHSRSFVTVFSPTDEIQIPNIKESLRKVISLFPSIAPKLSETVVKKVISLEETIENLIERVQVNLRMSFKEFSKAGNSTQNQKEIRINVVVSFLAMLELVKRGIIQVTQNNAFGDIHMENQQIETPKYGL